MVKEIGTFRNTYQEANPDIRVMVNDKSEIVLCFKEMKYVGTSGSTLDISNLEESSVTVGRTLGSESIDDQMIKNSECSFNSYFGGYSSEGVITSFIGSDTADCMLEGITGKETEEIRKAAAKAIETKLFGEAIGVIPLFGDVGELMLEAHNEQVQIEQNLKFIETQFSNIEAAEMYSEFDCRGNYIQYDTSMKQGQALVVNVGERTDAIISKMNETFGTEFTRETILQKADDVWNWKQEVISDEENKRAYQRAITVGLNNQGREIGNQ